MSLKSLYIAEKPSVAQEFGKALHENLVRRDGYLESENSVVTWCVGHLVTMSYPDKYDEKYKRWSFDTLPFLPKQFQYEVIPGVKKQFNIVKGLLNRKDVGTIFVCTDSGREGEYIYRLVAQMAGIREDTKPQKRVWIDSQTEEEIQRGIREAKDLAAYDNLSDAAYLRAKEDYLMGINFSRALSLRYAYAVSDYLGKKYQAISVGRVMTCVLGMVVRREREIRAFQKTPFYRVMSQLELQLPADGQADGGQGSHQGFPFEGEWRVWEESRYYQSPKLYKENGFRERKDAEALIDALNGRLLADTQPGNQTGTAGQAGVPGMQPGAAAMQSGQAGGAAGTQRLPGSSFDKTAVVVKIERKQEKKNPPLLYNLAELQNDCSRRFKISPDQTLQIAQELYEKKLVTYPRTDARVLSTAIAKQIDRNLKGLCRYQPAGQYAQNILQGDAWKKIGKTRYTNDKQITDHYAIIPTGQGLEQLQRISELSRKVYDCIVRRFLSIFYPAAVYRKIHLITEVDRERFHSSFRILEQPGYLEVAGMPGKQSAKGRTNTPDAGELQDGSRANGNPKDTGAEETDITDAAFLEQLTKLKKGDRIPLAGYRIREGETSPPKRYTSGSMILAMENAGQLIEDEELRAQIKGSGIGTSATRAEILKKLVAIKYLALNKKTQVITPTQMGEMVYDVVDASIRPLLNPELTASWEKGLTYVSEGSITTDEYMQKLEAFVARHTQNVQGLRNQSALKQAFDRAAPYYKKGMKMKR
ncbi:MAG: type IA DNA topoisomerase [Eubacterium sp.]|nr:type IA DNA topoisomerase [Eubacterium sp.]